MAPNASDRSKKRTAVGAKVAERPAKRQRQPTRRLLESQLPVVLPSLPATQQQPSQRGSTPVDALLSPTPAPSSPPRLSQRASPRRNIPLHSLFVASQALSDVPFESQVRDNKARNALLPPEEGSIAATEASEEVVNSAVNPSYEVDRLVDDFTGIEWARLPGLMMPLVQSTCKKSWVYKHGYRCVLQKDPRRVFWVCHLCHKQRIIDHNGPGKYEVPDAITTPATHMRKTHGLTASGETTAAPIANGQRSVRQMFTMGKPLSQDQANAMGNFDAQGFRMAAVAWLIENNHPLREFETPAFRSMMEFANPEAARALWASHNSVSRFVMKVYSFITLRNNQVKTI
ncbi:hat domain-containing protein [Stemphylium lycopersici]|uniref:Hat domain-containing protein n=1 Tax=Stemphylium lycopersici TaxID=183478 RepID=A0A364MRG6_STELY|nr:hypothetical protein TW65_98868 [Stemphylium lycopersici]RAQ98565.1 hat domain-containing protein [Stemphylium lycopersici]RAR00003.1 hat domain-containing protein [Stemphylium lycopersici]